MTIRRCLQSRRGTRLRPVSWQYMPASTVTATRRRGRGIRTWPPCLGWVQRDVDEGREHLNYSEWNRSQEGEESAESVREGWMPPSFYTLIHPDARLTDAESTALGDGLEATFGGEDDWSIEVTRRSRHHRASGPLQTCRLVRPRYSGGTGLLALFRTRYWG